MSQPKLFPQLFKGIAVFTPGGDLIYCIDPDKRNRWHSHLCAGLQEILGLPEPPHFLVPCYTATIDRWLDPRTGQVETFAEAYPLVLRYQALLNAVFGTGELVWQAAPWSDGLCDPMVLAAYRSSFSQLWEEHDLIFRFERSPSIPIPKLTTLSTPRGQPEYSSYVLRLFVAGNSVATERIFQTLHQLLEQYLGHPYTLKVIDVFKYPEQAEMNQVSATPTLVRVCPAPIKRFVGDLNDVEKLLQMLAEA